MKNLLVVLLSLFFFTTTASLAEARSETTRQRTKSSWRLSQKPYRTIMFMLKNSEELDLSEAQISSLKDQKYALKKNKIMSEAEIKSIKLGIKREKQKADVDIEEINSLIDQMYEKKAKLKKDLVSSDKKIHEGLTEQQLEKMCSLRKEAKQARYKRGDACREKYGKEKKR